MKDLTKGKESRQILFFALPMLFGNVFQQLYNITDSVIVGNYLGKDALAAVGACFPIVFTVISLIIGIGSGGTVVISQYFGAKDKEQVQKTIGTLYIFLTISSIILSVASILFAEDLLRLIQLPEELIPQAKTYLQIYLGGLIVFFGFNTTSAILRGLGDSKTPLYFLIISTVINILLDLLFVIVFRMGVAGVAWATIIAQGGAFISAIIYLNKTHEIIKFDIKNFRFHTDIFAKCIRIGLPTGIQHTFISLGMIALISIVNGFGTNVIAAYTIAVRIDSLALLPAMNLAQALSTFVGQNIGAGKNERIKKGLRATMAYSLIISVSVTILVVLFSEPILGMFTKDQAVIDVGKSYLHIVTTFYFLFSVMFAFNGVLRGAGATLIPMFISLFSLWVVRIPLAWWLSDSIGYKGIWWAIPIAWTSGVIITYIYYLSGKWKNKSVIQERILIAE